MALLRTRCVIPRLAGCAAAIRPSLAHAQGSAPARMFRSTSVLSVNIMDRLAPGEEPIPPPEQAAEFDKEAIEVGQMVLALNLRQAAELCKWITNELGISDAPVAVAAGGGAAAAAAAAPAAAEQTAFSLKLESFGTEKIKVIKEVRAITNLALKEAKALVESAPCELKAGLSKEEADKLKAAIEACPGAKVSLV